MNIREILKVVTMSLAITLSGSTVLAESHGEAPAMDEEMAKWMELAKPGEEHKTLASMAGSWETTTKHWMAPGAPVEESTGSAELEMILDGRFLEQHYSGNMMGMPFEGHGVLGFDRGAKEYNHLWFDNFGTMMMYSVGAQDEDGGIVLHSEMADPFEDKVYKVRQVVKIESEDKWVLEMFMSEGENEFKNLEVVHTRK